MSNAQTLASEVDLKNCDFIILVDQSGSMNDPVGNGNNKTKWEYIQERVTGLAGEAESKYDDNGIGVYFFNNDYRGQNDCGRARISEIFAKESPKGSTETGKAVKHILEQYRNDRNSGKTSKSLWLGVFTDGGADDASLLRNAIIEHANWMGHDSWTGILFAQVGHDPKATELLNDLDNNLKGAKYDIVTTRTMEQFDAMSYEDIFKSAFTD